MDHSNPHPEFYNLPFTTDRFNGMPYRALGNSGLRVSNIGLGTWKFGYPETGDGSRVNEPDALAILDRAIEVGVTFWDTANRYNLSSGNSERIIGTWLAANPGQRRNVVLATKIFGGMDGKTPNHCGLSRSNIIDSVHASLARLQTEYVDVLYFHAFDPRTPPEESLVAVDDLVRQGLVRYFAVSNFTVDQIRNYQQLETAISPRCRVLAVQNKFNILTGETPAHEGVLDHAAGGGISLVAYEPLARGLLTNRYLDPQDIGPGDRIYDEGSIEEMLTDGNLAKVRTLAEMAEACSASVSQLVLAYMLTLPGMGPAIPSSSSVGQLEDNATAAQLVLSDEQCQRISSVVGY